MAEKRQSTAGKVATPIVGAQMSELDAALAKAVGARIKITTLQDSILEGTVFTACPVTNLIAINTTPAPPNPSSALANQPGDYHIIPVSHIKEFRVLALPGESDRVAGSGPGFEGALPSISKVDVSALKAREQDAIQKIKQKDALKGRGVSKEAQELFDWISRTLPTRWAETSIVVSDSVIISEPYALENARAPKDKQTSLSHVRKVMEAFYRKKGAPPVNRPAVATPIAPRKGG